jgi:two-component system, response regulator
MNAAMPVEILLVEDNPDDEHLTLRALSKHNLANHVHVVRDGEEALTYLAENVHPRLVLLDLKLPRIDGLEVLKRVKADSTLRSIPIVVLTSSRQGPDVARAYEAGANSYIVKPVDFEQFVEAVSEAGLYWLLLNQSPSQ